jgi:hypothetical protein
MSKFSLFSQEEQSTIPLKKTPESISIVAKASEEQFQKLLLTIETDFPEIKIIYKRLSPGKLWITDKSPYEASP